MMNSPRLVSSPARRTASTVRVSTTLLAVVVLAAGVAGEVVAGPCGASGLQRADDRYESASPDNALVRDKVTGLVWRRCAEGQRWNGSSCEGTAASLTWPAAIALGGGGWRLPSHRELLSLIDRSCFGPAMNRKWFPETPAEVFWTSTSNPEDVEGKAWTVDFFDGGYKGAGNKNGAHLVRLVRTGAGGAR